MVLSHLRRLVISFWAPTIRDEAVTAKVMVQDAQVAFLRILTIW